MTFPENWQIAKECVEKSLEKSDGTLEAGMARLGKERFAHTVLKVEVVLDRIFPKEDQ